MALKDIDWVDFIIKSGVMASAAVWTVRKELKKILFKVEDSLEDVHAHLRKQDKQIEHIHNHLGIEPTEVVKTNGRRHSD